MRRAQERLDNKDYTQSWKKVSRGQIGTRRGSQRYGLAGRQAKAARGLAEQSAKPPKSDPKGTASLREARQLAAEVAKSRTGIPGRCPAASHSNQARQFQREAANAPNGGTFNSSATPTPMPVAPIAATRPKARTSIRPSTSKSRPSTNSFHRVRITKSRRKTIPIKEIKELHQNQADKPQQGSSRTLPRTLQLADDKVDVERLNQIRYFVCYFHYLKENYDEAIVVGDFLVKRYPDFRNSREHPGRLDFARFAISPTSSRRHRSFDRNRQSSVWPMRCYQPRFATRRTRRCRLGARRSGR